MARFRIPNQSGFGLFFLILCLLAPAGSAQTAFEINEESLSAAIKEVLPWIEKETGIDLERSISARLATREDLASALRESIEDRRGMLDTDLEFLEEHIESIVSKTSKIYGCLYDPARETILVCSQKFETQNHYSPEVLRALLARECVHAADHQKYDIRSKLRSLKDTGANAAFRAVIEGHAQFVARKVCSAAGWSSGVEILTGSAVRGPSQVFEGEQIYWQHFGRLLGVQTTVVYHEGEKFIQALFEEGGPDAVDRAFSIPPPDPRFIYHPAWFLYPESCEELIYDFDRALGLVVSRYDVNDWLVIKSSSSRNDIDAVLSLLPPHTPRHGPANLKQNSVVVLTSKDVGSDFTPLLPTFIALRLLEFAAPAEALRYVTAMERLHLIQDEEDERKDGVSIQQIYEFIRKDLWQGIFYQTEDFVIREVRGQTSLIVCQGPVALEILCSGKLVSKDELTAIASQLMTSLQIEMVAGSATAPDYMQDVPEFEVHRKARLAWWREARFGLFIHWGPVSLKGTEIGWSRKGPRRGHRSGAARSGIPIEIYDNLYKDFNPVAFDAEGWAQIAKDTGMRYVVYTTKHHDGFVSFDSRLTDYKITSLASPFGRDIVAELTAACRDAGLAIGYYYSPPDWHHPDYGTEHHDRYVKYMHEQVEELLTNYGKVDLLWFDGLGGTSSDWDSKLLFYKIKNLQPQVIINNRCGLPGDYDTPEQRIGPFQVDRPWETCMTLCRQWAWKPDDTMKSLRECIRILVQTVGGDGNLLLNVGPMPDGRIEPRQVTRLKEIGQWLKKYGQAIYGTRGGPFKPDPWIASTYKDNKIYVHVLNWPGETLHLPPIDASINTVSVLGGGHVEWNQSEENITLSVAAEARCNIDTIVVLEIVGPTERIAPVSLGSTSLAFQKKASASNFFRKMDEYGPAKAFDGDPATRWATDSGTRQAWLENDLGAPCTFNSARISEAYDGRVEKFQIEYKTDGKWMTCRAGNKLGTAAFLQFEPVCARHVRLNILEANEGPSIWEFQLFNYGKTDKAVAYDGILIEVQRNEDNPTQLILRVNGKEVTDWKDLYGKINSLHRENPEWSAIIRAVHNTEFKYIQKVMEACTKAGLKEYKVELAVPARLDN